LQSRVQLVFAVACTNEAPATNEPTVEFADPTVEPSAAEPGLDISDDQMAAIALTKDDVAAEFPDLVFDPGLSGFVSNASLGEDTFSPDDTADDIGAAGRLAGYSHDFVDISGFFGRVLDGPVFVQSAISLFGSESQVSDFLAMRIEAAFEYGEALSDAKLGSIRALEATGLGEEVAGFRLEEENSGPGNSVGWYRVLWRRGSAMPEITVRSHGFADYKAAVFRLAHTMDSRFEPALAGEITVVAKPRPRTASDVEAEAAARQAQENLALAEGYDLREIADLGDILAGFDPVNEVFVTRSETALPVEFRRTYDHGNRTGPVGNAEVAEVFLSVVLFERPFLAPAPVQSLRSLTAKSVGEKLVPVMLRLLVLGEDPDRVSIETTSLDVSGLGDYVVAFELTLGTRAFETNWHYIVFSRGRLTFFMYVVGYDLNVADTVAIAEVLDEHAVALRP
jgi:hypothetical protein